MHLPDYHGGSIVNLMRSIERALTGWHAWLREFGCVATTLRFRARHGGEPLSRAGIAPRSVYMAEPLIVAEA